MKEEYFLLDSDVAPVFQHLYPENLVDAFSKERFLIGGIADGKAVSLMVCSSIEDTILLEWLYVDPDYRNQSIGTTMIEKLQCEIAASSGQDIVVFTDKEDLVDLLDGLYFRFEQAGNRIGYTTTIGSMMELPVKGGDASVKRLSDLTELELKSLNQFFFTHPEITIGVSLPIETEKYLPISRVVMNKNEPETLVLLGEEEDALVVRYVYTAGSGRSLMNVLGLVRKEAMDSYGPDKQISVCALNEVSEQLVKKLFRQAEEKTVYKGYWMNLM